MKKILITLIIFIVGLSALAGEKGDALEFFNHFLSAYDSYNSTEVLNLYSNNAKFIRQLIDNGKLIDTQYFSKESYTEQIKFELKINKIYKDTYTYKKCYTDISVEKVSNGYKINATRYFPGDPNTKTYIIVQKQPNGKWLIIEEMIQLTRFRE